MSRLNVATISQPEAAFAAIETLKHAIAFHQRDDLKGAEAGYRAALALDPGQAYALQLLGVLLAQTGRAEEGLARIDEAIALAPDRPDVHYARGEALKKLRRFDEALLAFDAALKLKPDHFSSWSGRGGALIALNKVGLALEAYARALEIKPNDPETLALSAEALATGRFFHEAFEAIKRALAIKPDCAVAWVQCGTLLHNFGRMEEALTCFDTAIAVAAPQSAEEMQARTGRCVALGRLRRYDDTFAAFEDTLTRSPRNFEARFQRASVHLSRGDFAAGWVDYEARFVARSETARFVLGPMPVWRGEPLAGKKILIHDEQGNGDIMMFARFLCELEARGADVTMEARQGLIPLLRTLPGGVKVTTAAENRDAFDYQCPVMSLALGLGVELANLPANIPYFTADPDRVAFWRERLGGGFKVGIVWSASIFGFRQGRSAALADFAPLSKVAGVRLISLQKEVGVELLRAPPPGMRVETLGPDYDNGDFLETAAVLMSLDLVVCVDTAVAHLAGALGRPVWVVLPYTADWRWMLDRPDSPWYPTLRLFRSRAHGDWAGVFADVEKSLRELEANESASVLPAA